MTVITPKNTQTLELDALHQLDETFKTGYGIALIDNDGHPRPTNEVLIDICRRLKEMRDGCESKEEFEKYRHTMFQSLVGVRYVNELYAAMFQSI